MDSGSQNIYPYPTLAQTITKATNEYYAQLNVPKVRICTFMKAQKTESAFTQTLRCMYDDIDQALIFRMNNGTRWLDSLGHAPPPPPDLLLQKPDSPAQPPPDPSSGVPPANIQGLSGCFITSADCGAHGVLVPLSPSGCTCKCDSGWINAEQPRATSFYCSGR